MPRSKATSAERASTRSSAKKSKKTTTKSKVTKSAKASDNKKFKKVYDTETSKKLVSAINKLAAERKVTIFEVTKKNAADIHAELRKGSHARELTKGKVRTEFIYNYFACKHGSYLTGSTQLDGKKPDDSEYSENNGKSNFWWNGLRIFALRQKTGKKELTGFVIMHRAYLSMYPGSDESYYDVDPRMIAGRRNITKEVGADERFGSPTWADVPILCGSGNGDLLIALALVYSGMQKLIVSVATGEENEAMQSLLSRWGFKRVTMTHPESGDPWEDEDGDESYVMYRESKVSRDEILDHTKDGKYGVEKKKPEKKTKTPRKTITGRESKTTSTKDKAKEAKAKQKEKMENMKKKYLSMLTTKDQSIAKLKTLIKEKDSVISELKAKTKKYLKGTKTKKAKLMSLFRKAFHEVFEDEPESSVSKTPSEKKTEEKTEKKTEKKTKKTPAPKKTPTLRSTRRGRKRKASLPAKAPAPRMSPRSTRKRAKTPAPKTKTTRTPATRRTRTPATKRTKTPSTRKRTGTRTLRSGKKMRT